MAPPLRILLTHPPEMRRNYYGEAALAGLRLHGEVVLHEREAPLDSGSLIVAARGCQVVVADRSTPVPADVLSMIPDVVAVCRVAVDVRNIDIEAASSAGILITQASRSWVPAVSELVLGLMIDAARGISRANIAYKAGRAPEVRMGRQLAGSTAGIIGYGPLGARVAELCVALGMTVLVADPYKPVTAAGCRQVGLGELLAGSDFVLPLAVATAQTENLIGAAELAAMKPDAFLINLSRGNLIDEAALTLALDGGRLAGVAMDVGRAPDQMPQPALAARPEVSATPHIGGLTRPGIEGQALETVEQVGEIARGRPPKGALNGERATRLKRLAG